MKTIFKISVSVLCLMIFLPIGAQEDNKEKRETVEKNTAPFGVDYFDKSKNSFYVLSLNVQDGELVLDEEAVLNEVPGKLPYARGNFKVSMLDQDGRIIGEHHMPDPLLIRSCDKEGNNFKQLDKGLIQIPLVKSTEITQIVFTRGKERVATIDLSEMIKRFNSQEEDRE